MNYKILYSIYKTKRLYDCWMWSIVSADTKEEAINKLKQQCERRNINFKYIVKVKELNWEVIYMLCAIMILLFQIIILLAFLTICIVGGSNDYE